MGSSDSKGAWVREPMKTIRDCGLRGTCVATPVCRHPAGCKRDAPPCAGPEGLEDRTGERIGDLSACFTRGERADGQLLRIRAQWVPVPPVHIVGARGFG